MCQDATGHHGQHRLLLGRGEIAQHPGLSAYLRGQFTTGAETWKGANLG
jgi:hypothetical protein